MGTKPEKSMDYKLGEKTFSLSYSELKAEHERFCDLTDEEFMRVLPQAAHLACIISYLKELHRDMTLSDMGIVHQLCHLMTIHHRELPPGSTINDTRELFRDLLKLA